MKILLSNMRSQKETISQKDSSEFLIWNHPIFQKMFSDFAPHLLKPNSKEKQLLQVIGAYLFNQKELDSETLEKELIPEFYGALYGLKTLLQEHSFEKAAQMLQEHEQRFLSWAKYQFKT